MKTTIAIIGLVVSTSSILQIHAQSVGDGVILTGGLGPAREFAPEQTQVVYQTPVIVYQQPVACAVPVYTALAGGYYNPNVIYFGGPNSCYRNYYAGCNYSPNVLYFGRGQAYYQGYRFTYPR